ncbi:MAG: response regulator [Spirochaetota bacterium]
MSSESVVLVDDHPPLRAGVAAIIGRSERYGVVAEAGSVRDAIDAVRTHRPSFVIADISLPDGSGVDLARTLRELDEDVRILMLTMHARRALAERAFAAGANGYLLKESTGELLITALDELSAGRVFLDFSLRSVDDEPGPAAACEDEFRTSELLSPLSEREFEVFRMLAAGQNSKEVGALLGISSKTVDNHRSRIMEKLGVDSVAGLVRVAIRTGAIDP